MRVRGVAVALVRDVRGKRGAGCVARLDKRIFFFCFGEGKCKNLGRFDRAREGARGSRSLKRFSAGRQYELKHQVP